MRGHECGPCAGMQLRGLSVDLRYKYSDKVDVGWDIVRRCREEGCGCERW